jgi:hypothetical protein
VVEPALAGIRIDLVGLVAHAQTRVTTSVAVGRWTAPVLLEKKLQTFACWLEIFFWIHRLENVIAGNALVELCRQPGKSFVPANLVEKGLIHQLLLFLGL